MGEGNSFSLFTSGGGYPISGPGRGVPHPRSQVGGTWSQVWGGTRSQVWGVPHLRSGGGPVVPRSKEKNFDTRFGLIHVQTGKKNIRRGTPPPHSEGKNFWHQIWLDTCSDRKKIFSQRDPLPPGIARTCYGYAAGGMPLAFTQEDFLVSIFYRLNDP